MKMKVGDAVIIRTVAYHYIGKVAHCDDQEIVLDEASWLAESARWSVTLTTGQVSELEPYPDWCCIRTATVVDYAPWNFPLPREAV